MHPHDSRLLGLLPTIGLCSCVVSSEAPTAAPNELGAPGLIEIEPDRRPPTTAEALIRSGRESLAAGHYAAAYASLTMAAEQVPERADRLRLDALDAALGLGDPFLARRMLAQLRPGSDSSRVRERLDSRIVQVHELENGLGVGSCDARIDEVARPLRRTSDALEAWNELRAGLPAEHALPIPTTVQRARERLCSDGCEIGEPTFVRLDGDNEATIGLIIAHGDGGFTVVPELLHTTDSGCGDLTMHAFERHDGLIRVRAFADRIDHVDASDWALVGLPQYGSPTVSSPTSYAYAYASSGYPSSGYPSSGYPSSGYAYASSGYSHGYHYGCGYYTDDYALGCEALAHVERDLILDLDRGELVLDIVRTGDRGSALGRVTMTRAPEGPVVDVRACGVSRSLQLSYT